MANPVDIKNLFKYLYGSEIRMDSRFLTVASRYINEYLSGEISQIRNEIEKSIGINVMEEKALELVAYMTVGPFSLSGEVVYQRLENDVKNRITYLTERLARDGFYNISSNELLSLSRPCVESYLSNLWLIKKPSDEFRSLFQLYEASFRKIRDEPEAEYYVCGLLLAKQPYQPPECKMAAINILLSRLSPVSSIPTFYPITSFYMHHLWREPGTSEFQKTISSWIDLENMIASELLKRE